jgi:hypothetical protein
VGRGLSAKSNDLIYRAQEILEGIQPATVRAVCYRLFSEGFISSMEKRNTDKVSGLLVRARETGLIPWEHIVDNTRAPRRAQVFSAPSAFAATVKHAFRLDPWEQQDVRIQVWSEKDTVSGTLAPVLTRYAVDFRVNRGFASATVINDVVNEVLDANDPRPVVALYVGDYDPSGLYMSEVDLPRRLEEYGYGLVDRFELRRVALVEADLDDLPDLSFPVADKAGDSRFAWYCRTTRQDRAWELDAMDPNLLRRRVEDAVLDHVDVEAWERVERGEQAQRQSLQAVMDGWAAIRG